MSTSKALPSFSPDMHPKALIDAACELLHVVLLLPLLPLPLPLPVFDRVVLMPLPLLHQLVLMLYLLALLKRR